MIPEQHNPDVQPITIGRLVLYRGRLMYRVGGAETPAPAAAASEPAEGDGGQGGEGNGLYDLSAAPEELRPFLEQELKKVEANVTRKFQEAADFRKKFEPLTGIDGLTEIEPEHLAELVEFYGVASDPDKFRGWWEEIGQELGFMEPDAEGDGRQGDELDDGGLDERDETIEELRAEIAELREALEPIGQHVTQQSQEQRIAAATEAINSELVTLHEQYGDFDDQAVCRLAKDYPADDPQQLLKGLQDYMRIKGEGATELVDGKLEQPGPATNGGSPDVAPQKFDGLGDPELKKAAAARFAAAR